MNCPICKKLVPESSAGESAAKFFPFCSDRCKLIDLGKWLDGAYQIPVDDQDNDEGNYDAEDPPETPRGRSF